MKIAIQGHPTRGKEIIQILESLGGINIRKLYGNGDLYYYSIDCGIITFSSKNILYNYKYYTLEEFEKEFPFKVGDKVFLGKNNEHLYTIKSIKIWFDGNIAYEFAENGLHYAANKLTLYKEMKEERNITLTLDKAKEWYNKGGELKEIALQAFTEKELNPLPRSWEEFCINYPIKNGECYIKSCYDTALISEYIEGDRNIEMDRTVCPSQKSAKAHLAMIQLEQLRNCWWNGWEPIWDISQKYCIYLSHNEVQVRMCTNVARFLTFPTREMAIEFLECFRDLIELARNLI